MRAIAITSLIALGSTVSAGGPSADQVAGLMKAGAAISEGSSITTRLGGSTVSVTCQNGVVTCTVDGKPLALRVTAPAPKPAGLTTVADTVAREVTAAAPAFIWNFDTQQSDPLFQNSLIWFGRPNPTPPTPLTTFQPLAELPGFSRPMYGWMQDFEFEACVLGLSSTTKGQFVVGPYGTSTTSFSSSGCN